MLLQEALRHAVADLNALSASAAVVGGLAVSAWTEPRFTRDADLVVAVRSDAEAEKVVHALRGRGYALLATVEQTETGRLATARFLPPGEREEGLVVDLLFASSGIEPEIVAEAVEVDIGVGTSVRVARVGHLVALKLLADDPTTRPQDRLDLAALRQVLDDAEVLRAREACDLIEGRGYQRGRNLRAALEAYVAS